MKQHFSTLVLLLISFFSFAQAPSYTVPVHTSSSQGYYFLTTSVSGASTLLKQNLIMDKDGKLVYYQNMAKGQVCYDFKIQKNGLISYYTNNRYYIMDSTFNIIDSVQCKGSGFSTDLHELQILPNGNYLLMGEETVKMNLSNYAMFNGNGSYGSSTATVTSGLIQEQDKNKTVVFEWHAKDHFAFDDVDAYWLGSPTAVDWTHFNALELDTDGNILISSRHFNEITKINHSTGDIIWRLGGKNNQFAFSNDSFSFYGQHDIRRIANGHITLYDDGNHAKSHGARGVEYDLDEKNMSAKLVWSYTYDRTMFAYATGSTQRLANGNTLVNFGLISKNKVCFAVVDSSNNKVFELDFNGGVFSYRSFNYLTMPWSLKRPKITRFDSNGVSYLALDAGYSSYAWNTGDDTRIIPLTKKGTYYAFVPYGQGFISTEQLDVVTDPCHVKATIKGSFKACALSGSIFSSDTLNDYLTYKWRVTGGTVTSGLKKDSVHVKWDSSAISSITLIVGNNVGCVDSITNYVVINPLPKVVITGPNSFCSNYAPVFEAQVHAGSSYNWSVSGGTITSGQNTYQLSVKWPSSGSGTLTLTETTANGCVASANKPVNIFASPKVAILGSASVCKGNAIKYSTQADSNAVYMWNVNGGTIVSGQKSNSISVYWPAEGVGTVDVIETALGGCTDSTSIPVNINAQPKARFIAGNKCLGQSATFSDSSLNAETFIWNFGDGNSSTLSKPTHTYSTAGTYNVSLHVENLAGCADSITDKIIIYPLPNAHWSSSHANNVYTFDADDARQLDYKWDFGDGKKDSNYHVSHQYAIDSIYRVKLSISSIEGCQASFDSLILVKTSGIVQQAFSEGQVSIFPNPSTQNFTIQYTLSSQASVNISVYDLQGREIVPLVSTSQPAGTYTTRLDASTHNLNPGVYMMRMTIGSQSISKPMILTR